MRYVTSQGDVLDAVCLAFYGHAGAVEFVLNANPGLAALGAVLPMGVTIDLPAEPPPRPAPRTTLWD